MKYLGSKLGIWWAVILPLLLALSISLIFTKAFKISIPNYTLFVLSAILPWIFFSQSLAEATNSFLANRSMLKQGIFLREIIPVSSAFGNFLNFIIGLTAIAPLFILFNYKILAYFPFLILLLISFLLFIMGLAFALSTMNVFYRDVSCFLSLGLMVWFWITPVFYSLGMIPYPYRIVSLANPLTYFILNFRNFLYYGQINIHAFFISSLISIIFFVAGYSILLIKEEELSKRL